MENLTLLVLGILISVLGIVNMMGNISTIHSYNRRRVTEEDAPKYGKAVGTGTLIIGASMLVSFFASFVWEQAVSAFIMLPAVVIGIVFILYAQFKYNKGIF